MQANLAQTLVPLQQRYNLILRALLAVASSLMIMVSSAWAQNPFEGNLAAINSGYGAEGTHTVSSVIVKNKRRYIQRDIVVYYPDGASQPSPTVFFSHAYGANDPDTYYELFINLASNGYVVVYVPYDTFFSSVEKRYDQLWDGFEKAIASHGNLMDLTRIGFAGHSFGGGATPSLAHRAFVDEGRGANGRFMFIMAPWYSYEITQAQLASFPTNTKLIMQVYNDDETNDHRMAIDVFTNINIVANEKDYVTVFGDSSSSYTFDGDHSMPMMAGANGEYNGFDSWAVFRHVQALADYAFNGTSAAKNIALGNGNATQVTMGTTDDWTVMTELDVSDAPIAPHPESSYTFECSTADNPRNSYC